MQDIFYYYYLLLQRSSHQYYQMVFHWSLSDIKSPQVSRVLLRILAVLNNAVIWVVSTRPPTSKSSSPIINPLVTVPRAPITIGTIVTFMFKSFFNSLARSKYLSFFSHSFSFILWSVGTAKSTIIIVAIVFSFESFSHQRQLMIFHWSQNDSKSHQVSRTLLSILANFNNAVVCSLLLTLNMGSYASHIIPYELFGITVE